MMVVLGELGGSDEYSLVEALKQGKVQKPVVAWVSGTCARLFKSEVQFGHAVSSKQIGSLFSWSSSELNSKLRMPRYGLIIYFYNRVRRAVVS